MPVAILVVVVVIVAFNWKTKKGEVKEAMTTGSSDKISKVIIQTSREKPEPYIIENFKAMMPDDWTYRHFTDADIKQFFLDNPLDEFPDVQAKFDAMAIGAHKADLFRYYYIYAKGGVFVDSDARLEKNIQEVCGDNSFFSVESAINPETIFQGFIGACPKNEIVYRALKDVYNMDSATLNGNYMILVANLYKIINEKKYDFPYKLFVEEYYEGGTPQKNKIARIFDPETNKTVLKHFHETKVVPPLRLGEPLYGIGTC